MIDVLLDQDDIVGAFRTSERAKARVLLEALNGGKLQVDKAETVAEKAEERRIRNGLAALNSEILRLRMAKQVDQERLADLNARLQKTRLEHETFQSALYAAHPEVRAWRSQFEPITLGQCAGLFPDTAQAMLEFVVSEDRTTLFVLTPDAKGGEPTIVSFKIAIKKKDSPNYSTHSGRGSRGEMLTSQNRR